MDGAAGAAGAGGDGGLSAGQRRIAACAADRGHLLVLAGPGAGKTRTLVARIGWLLAEGACEPEHVLALTFTHQAALELRDRLAARGYAGVTAATFHVFGAELLGRHGAAIGTLLPLRICDRTRQDGFLARAAEEIGWSLPERTARPARGEATVKEAADHVQRRKRAGLDPGAWRSDWSDSPHAALLAHLDEAYCRLLREAGALDYEDLLVEAVRLLRSDEEAATLVRRRLRYVFVDELHDVSPEQLELLRLIAPPGRAAHAKNGDGEPAREAASVMAVADPDQAIYGWRGADAGATLAAFRRAYRPIEHRLAENFRSTPAIVRAAGAVMDGHGGGARPAPVAVQPDGLPVFCVGSPDRVEEAERLAGYVERAIAERGYAHEDIAVLYRTHGRADAAEAALLRHGVPVRRIQPGRFFDQPDVQETLRYLDLAVALDDPSFAPALNWPRVVVDELAMIQLRRLAAARGLRLTELAARIADLCDEVSPLVRVAVEEFLDGIAGDLGAARVSEIGPAVGRLLGLLARRRPPLPSPERAMLRGVLAFLAGPLQPLVDALAEAVARGRPVALLPGDDLDSLAAAVLLEHVLRRYLRHPVAIRPRSAGGPGGAFAVRLGVAAAVGPDGFGLAERSTRSMRYAVSTLAWRLGQLLLMRYETRDAGRFTVFDLETGSLHANTTEPLELAAVQVEGGGCWTSWGPPSRRWSGRAGRGRSRAGRASCTG